MPTKAARVWTPSGLPFVLKDQGSYTKGKEARWNNITTMRLLGEMMKTSLGPKGMRKIVADVHGDVIVSGDGATILKELSVTHPAAKIMVKASKAVLEEVGDGTKSVVVLAGALLQKAEELSAEGLHPTVICDGYAKAENQALRLLDEISIGIPAGDKKWLMRVVKVSMSSEPILAHPILVSIVVEAARSIADNADGKFRVDIDNAQVKRRTGLLHDSQLISGLIIDKSVVHPGMSKRVENAKIALINAPLEVKRTEFDARICIHDPDKLKAFRDEARSILQNTADRIVSNGVNVLFCQKDINEIMQYYLMRAGILAVKDVVSDDMNRLARATGGRVLYDLKEFSEKDLGFAELVEERRFEGLFYEERRVFVEGCRNPKAVTILLSVGGLRLADEAQRCVRNGLMVAKDTFEKPAVVAGGGAAEAYLAASLEKWSTTFSGREQLAVSKYADALEAIPAALAQNAGMHVIDALVELRARQSQGQTQSGIGVMEGRIADMEKLEVYEPAVVKEQVIKSATEVANFILRVDEILMSKVEGE
jgi:thermosome